MTASPGARVLLTCHVVSTVSFNFTWLRGGREARLDPRMNMLGNLSLQVFPVTPEDSGWYSCIATNEGGATAERMFLTVQGEKCLSRYEHVLVSLSLSDDFFCAIFPKRRTLIQIQLFQT